MFNRSIRSNSVPLQHTKLQKLSELDFDLSRSLRVKCDDWTLYVWCLMIYIYSYQRSISHPLALMVNRNVLESLIIRPKCTKNRKCTPNEKPQMTLNATRPRYPIYVKVLSTSPKFNSVSIYYR